MELQKTDRTELFILEPRRKKNGVVHAKIHDQENHRNQSSWQREELQINSDLKQV